MFQITAFQILKFTIQSNERADFNKKSVVLYQVKFQEMTNLLVKYAASLSEPRNENQFLTKDEFKQVLRN